MKILPLALFLLVGITPIRLGAQGPGSTLAPRLRDFAVWLGDWTLVGTARDGPTLPEYKAVWKLHGTTILGGAFIQVDQVWQGAGSEARALEILSYDPVERALTASGFYSDGSTWHATATFEGLVSVARGVLRAPDGTTQPWSIRWTFSPDRMTVVGVQQLEQNGVQWTAFTLKGTKSNPPPR